MCEEIVVQLGAKLMKVVFGKQFYNGVKATLITMKSMNFTRVWVNRTYRERENEKKFCFIISKNSFNST